MIIVLKKQFLVFVLIFIITLWFHTQQTVVDFRESKVDELHSHFFCGKMKIFKINIVSFLVIVYHICFPFSFWTYISFQYFHHLNYFTFCYTGPFKAFQLRGMGCAHSFRKSSLFCVYLKRFRTYCEVPHVLVYKQKL